MTNGENDRLKVSGILFIAALAIILLYLIFKTILFVGVIAMIGAIALIIYGVHEGESALVFWSFVIFIAGLLLAVLGYNGVSFFEDNPVGQDLLESSENIVGTGADTAEAIINAAKIEQGILDEVTDQTLEALNQT